MGGSPPEHFDFVTIPRWIVIPKGPTLIEVNANSLKMIVIAKLQFQLILLVHETV
jgi:hypothetical protein